MSQLKVAVIGGGASGLTAVKTCLDEGMHPVCFEKQDSIGGMWKFVPHQREEATVYRSTVINTSKEMMCYSDFPIPKEFPNFMHNSKVYEYFHLYAKKFNLGDYVRYNTLVESCTPADGFVKNGHWRIVSKNLKTEEEKIEYFDGVMVCIGHHAIPHYPLSQFPGIEKFKGKYMHSHDYRDQKGFEDMRVVVVGIGNSGGDISIELSRHCKQTYLSTRRGAWILNRVHDNGMPVDINLTNRMSSFLSSIVPIEWVQGFMEKQLNKRFDHEKYGLKPKHLFLSQHPNVSDDLPNRIITGCLQVKPNVVRFTENSAVFDDGTEEEIDAVIFATGYSFNFPFLDDSILKVEENDCDLYKHVWPTSLERNTLAIIGAVQPLGAVNPISEIQCRWVTRVIKGLGTLPNRRAMQKDVERKRSTMQKRYVKSRRHTIQVDYVQYMDEIASQIGCKPNVWKYLLTDPALGLKLIFGPAAPYQYRLDGPGKWPEARHAIMTIMDRVMCPFETRKVEKSKPKRGFGAIIFFVFVAIFFSWIFGLI